MQTQSLPGHLAINVMHFARVLRVAGLPVGTDRVQLALSALVHAGLESREDFRAALATCFIDRREQIDLFDQAFYIFWRDPDLLGRIMAMMLPRIAGRDLSETRENQRLAQALFPGQGGRAPEPPEEEQIEFDAAFTVSNREALRQVDFETMTALEWAEAKAMLARLEVFFARVPTRRTRAAPHPGTLDWRATMKSGSRQGGMQLHWRKPRMRPAPVVILADISGSMSKYSRMLLHFAHALTRSDVPVASFVFGTRLTSITRHLRERDVDLAVEKVVGAVADWSGGTRIHACLTDFNRNWSRRVLGQNATVLLITDGLEHGDAAGLAFETERLSKSCHRLVWLNPLLRFSGFEARAAGVRAMLPWVDEFVPAHNLASLESLARLLADSSSRSTPHRVTTWS